jgi:hypothetical protein
MDENATDSLTYQRGKILVPHNPQNEDELDYVFGTNTKDCSFKSLMWNNVYSIKSFIPRFQKKFNIGGDKFSGIKKVNMSKGNNPMPYNNIRIEIPFMFWFLCSAAKLFVTIVQMINELKFTLMMNLGDLGVVMPWLYISNELCPNMTYWYFAPGMNISKQSLTLTRLIKSIFTKKDNCKNWENKSITKTFKKIANAVKDIADTKDNTEAIVCVYIGTGNEKKAQMVSLDEIENIITKGGKPRDWTNKDINNIDDIKQLAEDIADEISDDYSDANNWAKVVVGDAVELDRASAEVQNALTEVEEVTIKLTPNVDYLMQCIEMNLAQEYEVIKFDFYNDWINGVIYLPRWVRDIRYKRKRKHGKTIIEEKAKGCINGYKNNYSARRYVHTCSMVYDVNGNISESMPNGCSNNGHLKCHTEDGMSTVPIFAGDSGIVQEQKTILDEKVYYMKPKEFTKFNDFGIPLFATDIIMLGSLFDCNEYGLPSTFNSLQDTTYNMPPNMATTNTDDDMYTYVGTSQDSLPTVKEILSWKEDVCTLDKIVTSTTSTIPSYSDIIETLNKEKLYGDANVLEYEDIFPITEMSGIEWGFTGPDQEEPTNDKLFSPGGHFMGLACSNAQTNIKSCVNLKRACEIGVDLSTRFEIPIGSRGEEEVMYLYVSPSGLISKDQIYDVTFRSAFATMNQNSLATVIDEETLHKRYDFKYLLPDSFDGCLSTKIKEGVAERYNKRINLEWDSYWDDKKDKFDDNVILEQGFTVHRTIEVKSNDYISFRNKNFQFLKSFNNDFRMPVYSNSFYFYFGLKKGFTALDEFKRQFFAKCK